MKKTTLHHPLPYPQTPETARAELRRHGICIAHWAKDMGVPRAVVVDLLRQRGKGHRGMAHRAAVALGLKPNPKKGA